jgi:hypothetical protein
MDTIMYENFNFNSFMRRRGWTSLLWMLLWVVTALFISGAISL